MLCIDKAIATNKTFGSEKSDAFALGATLSFGLKRKQATMMTNLFHSKICCPRPMRVRMPCTHDASYWARLKQH